MLRYSSPFAGSSQIEPNPARPSDFTEADFQSFAWIFNDSGVPFDTEEIRQALRNDSAPIPATNNREGYFGEYHLAYWLSGFAAYKQLAALAAKHGVTRGAYFDFGGSTGRVFRNFHYQSAEWSVWSCDFKISSVDWNLAHFPPEIAVFQGMYLPFLPIEDRTFDLISAMSVFTHIDETETNWLLELRRIMKPGGIAMVTIHNEDTWANMPPELRATIERATPELAAQSEMPPGRSVSNFRLDDPYRCNTFHSNDYIRSQWSRFFDVKEIISRASGAQAIVVLQKRA